MSGERCGYWLGRQPSIGQQDGPNQVLFFTGADGGESLVMAGTVANKRQLTGIINVEGRV